MAENCLQESGKVKFALQKSEKWNWSQNGGSKIRGSLRKQVWKILPSINVEVSQYNIAQVCQYHKYTCYI